jgi:formylglycine-generating enzyme required for sulfatase activity
MNGKLALMVALMVMPVLVEAQGFTNSLGMKFVPVPGTKVLFCTTEVTVDQYKAAGLGYEAPRFAQAGNHPAVNVSWNDAKAYCAWLSKREGKKYRLPTDREWSCAVGIGEMESAGGSPESKSGKIPDVFPWGRGKPSGKAGNYMGQEWRKEPARAKAYFTSLGENNYQLSLIPDYDDGYLFTAPVGSYAANNLGIYDLGGNVWEWCEDKYSKAFRVLRGGSWGNGGRGGLLSSCRGSYAPGVRNDYYGFRVVCEAGSGR